MPKQAKQSHAGEINLCLLAYDLRMWLRSTDGRCRQSWRFDVWRSDNSNLRHPASRLIQQPRYTFPLFTSHLKRISDSISAKRITLIINFLRQQPAPTRSTSLQWPLSKTRISQARQIRPDLVLSLTEHPTVIRALPPRQHSLFPMLLWTKPRTMPQGSRHFSASLSSAYTP